MSRMYLHELRAHFKSLAVWTVILLSLVGIAMMKFQGYYNNPEMLEILNAMPRAFLDAFKIRAFNLTTVEGFFGVLARYYYIMAAVAAALWGNGMVSKEELSKTADFTLVLPVSRRVILTAKALAALTNAVTFVLLTWAISLAFAQKYGLNAGFYRFLAKEMAGMFFIALVFWAVGVFLACALRNPRRAGSVGVGIALALFVLYIAQGMHEKLEFLKWVTPFAYFDAASFYRGESLNPYFVAITLLVSAVLIGASYALYERRDVYL